MPDVHDLPMVSVIIPCRNEADFIEITIGSVLANDYPPEKFEVLVIDGLSDDGTAEVVAELSKDDSRVELFANPERIVPHAMNKGIAESCGDIIIRIDGHAKVAPDFIRQSVATLQAHEEAWCVGGAIETVNARFIGKAIAAAMSSPVGVGNAMFRLGQYEGHVDTIAFGAYWKWVFDKIGLFDEELVRNQDDELNMRLILGGGKIWMSRAIRSWYYPRSNLRKLWRQYFQYGFWRIRTMQKHRRPATLRQIAPLLFVLIWITLIGSSLLWWPMGWALAGFAAIYLLALLAGAVDVARKAGLKEALLAPLIFMILHFAYGLGSLKGIAWFLLLRRGGKIKGADHALSR